MYNNIKTLVEDNPIISAIIIFILIRVIYKKLIRIERLEPGQKELKPLPPSAYQQTRGALEDIEGAPRSVRGQQDVFKRVVKRSSAFMSEDKAKKIAKGEIAELGSVKPEEHADATKRLKTGTSSKLEQLFLAKAAQLSDSNPALAAVLISGQGLDGYLKATGKSESQVASELGVEPDQFKTILDVTAEAPVEDLRTAEKRKQLAETAGLDAKQQGKLNQLMQQIEIKKTQNEKDIRKAEPQFSQIQSNLIQQTKK
tara:strand:+ start:14638 stop:15405 length:768 start_codon:yes stop_codon:yes gene_type:complete